MKLFILISLHRLNRGEENELETKIFLVIERGVGAERPIRLERGKRATKERLKNDAIDSQKQNSWSKRYYFKEQGILFKSKERD